MINGSGGVDISEPVIDFIAKHHSYFNSIFWLNASHPLSITTTVDDIVKVMICNTALLGIFIVQAQLT